MGDIIPFRRTALDSSSSLFKDQQEHELFIARCKMVKTRLREPHIRGFLDPINDHFIDSVRVELADAKTAYIIEEILRSNELDWDLFPTRFHILLERLGKESIIPNRQRS